jgi:hypothetical protein
MQKVKLLWDFRGPDSLKMAEHHAIHLCEFIAKENLENCEANFEAISEFISSAFIICPKDLMITLRDALKPHRGEAVDE